MPAEGTPVEQPALDDQQVAEANAANDKLDEIARTAGVEAGTPGAVASRIQYEAGFPVGSGVDDQETVIRGSMKRAAEAVNAEASVGAGSTQSEAEPTEGAVGDVVLGEAVNQTAVAEDGVNPPQEQVEDPGTSHEMASAEDPVRLLIGNIKNSALPNKEELVKQLEADAERLSDEARERYEQGQEILKKARDFVVGNIVSALTGGAPGSYYRGPILNLEGKGAGGFLDTQGVNSPGERLYLNRNQIQALYREAYSLLGVEDPGDAPFTPESKDFKYSAATPDGWHVAEREQEINTGTSRIVLKETRLKKGAFEEKVNLSIDVRK